MTSNVYLAFGEIDEVMVIKTSKADFVYSRQAQLKMHVETYVQFDSERAALDVEAVFRKQNKDKVE